MLNISDKLSYISSPFKISLFAKKSILSLSNSLSDSY